jgi:hypothetical protein
MKEIFSIQVIIGLAVIIGGWIGYKIKSYIDIKQEFVSKASEKRREMYQAFLSIIFGLWRDLKLVDENVRKQDTYLQEIGKKLYEFYIPFLLYASPTTIKNLGELMQYLYTQQVDGKKLFYLLGKVIFSMRKEIGLSNKGLKEIELFKPMLTDYQEFFGK